MPLVTIERLTGAPEGDSALARLAMRLPTCEPGIVLSTGQASSGKVTILLALAQLLARDGRGVALLAAREGEFDVFRPLPAGWSERVVAGNADAWGPALAQVPAHDITVVAPLDRNCAPALWRQPPGRWLLAAVDTPLLGHDAAYALREMGVGYADFLARTRCVWSQFLLESICGACAQPASMSDAELHDLLPGKARPARLLHAPGCASCGGKGTDGGRRAVSEVLVIDASSRETVARALEEGTAVPAGDGWHVTVHELGFDMLAKGELSVDVYRDVIRRNPLLRAQNQLEREQAHSQRLGSMFEKFVSPEVKERLLASRSLQDVAGGEARDITCLFCDLRGFTARAESSAPSELFADLNRYFAEVVDCVLAHDGTIDKFIGDAVMVIWGAPLDQADHASRAVACALAIRERIEAFNAAHAADLPFSLGIGINSGSAAAGCVGTDQRMEYTVLGDTVNVAARLEARARAGQILVSRSTREAAGDAFSYGAPQDYELKGKAVTVQACEVIGRR